MTRCRSRFSLSGPAPIPPAGIADQYADPQRPVSAERDDEADREMWFVAIRDAMAQMLQRGELLSISVALAMVPSQDTYKIVWDALRAAVEQPDGRCACVCLAAGAGGR
jgi:hypothetical protein